MLIDDVHLDILVLDLHLELIVADEVEVDDELDEIDERLRVIVADEIDDLECTDIDDDDEVEVEIELDVELIDDEIEVAVIDTQLVMPLLVEVDDDEFLVEHLMLELELDD